RPESVHLDRHEAELGLVEVRSPLHLARGLQLSVQAVDPTVVAALKRLAVATSRHHLRGAMAAHVVEPAQPSVEAVGQKDRLVDDRGGLEVTGSRELAAMGD